VTRLLTVIAALLLLAGAVSCTANESAGLQPHSEHKGPAGAVPPGLLQFYGQTLAWGPCANYATTAEDRESYQSNQIECARMTVPMDYQNPQGPSITLGLLRRPASDPAHRIGSLLVNPGGPGASGMSAAASLSTVVAETDLGRRFDLVGFDPRGVGSSQPEVHCLTDQERDTERLQNQTDNSPGGVAKSELEEQNHAGKCAQRTGAGMLANIGTRDVAKDMDVMRSALGDQKLTYLGYSYGTRLGSQYAEEFPANVRSMVLDGAIDPTQSEIDSQLAQAAGFQKAFNDFAGWCAGQRDCALGTNPNNAVAAFQRLTRPLEQHPVPTGDGRQLSYSDATTGAIQALYSPQMWTQLNTGLGEIAQGRGTTLMELADSYFGRGPNGRYSNITDAFDATRCVDDPRLTDPAMLQDVDRRSRQAAPFLDDGQPPSPAKDLCAFWPAPVTGVANQPVAPSLPPTLVISTTGDPATPYVAGQRLASVLHGDLLTFEGTQHTAFLQGNSCVDAAATRYLVDLAPPAPGTRCR
jgi:pimeloyl-ACP methyl ester carboxylesterase